MSVIQKIALGITIVGAIVWGLVGIFDFNLVAWMFQDASFLTRTVYIIVGLCGLFNLALLFIPNRHHIED